MKIGWKAIEAVLRREIEACKWVAGDRLPSGDELAVTWGVSRHTAHHALEELQRKGLVVRQRGMGTVIAESRRPARTVALLVDAMLPGANHPSSDLLRGLHAGLGEDVNLILTDAKDDPAVESRLLQRLRHQADGIVTLPTLKPASLPALSQLAATDYPLVLLDRVPPDITVDAVVTDNLGTATHAMEMLVARGHRRIGFLSFHKPTFSSVQERHAGYRQVMHSQGVDAATCKELTRWFPMAADHVLPVFERLVQDALASLLASNRPITAVFCVEDSLARAAILACERLGIDLARELEIVTFSNWLPDSLGRPWHLHRIGQDHFELGRLAAQRVRERIEHPTSQRLVHRVPGRLILADAGIESSLSLSSTTPL